MRTAKPNDSKHIKIGRLGDDNSVRVPIDVSKWIKSLGEDGTWSALALQPGELVAYIPEKITYENGVVYWDVQKEELTIKGEGKFQLIYTQENARSVSALYTTEIPESIFTNDPGVPTVYEAFYDKIIAINDNVNKKAAEVEENAELACKSAETATTKAAEAKSSQEAAAGSATSAAESEASAKEWEEKAEQVANTKGYIYVDGDSDGILYAHTSDGFGDDLKLADDGHGVLEVILQ